MLPTVVLLLRSMPHQVTSMRAHMAAANGADVSIRDAKYARFCGAIWWCDGAMWCLRFSLPPFCDDTLARSCGATTFGATSAQYSRPWHSTTTRPRMAPPADADSDTSTAPSADGSSCPCVAASSVRAGLPPTQALPSTSVT